MFTYSFNRKTLFPSSFSRLVVMLLLSSLLLVSAQNASPTVFAAPARPAHSTIAAPQILGLIDFKAKLTKNHTVLVVWHTGTEMDIVGFNVWKRAGKGEWKQLNTEMIEAKSMGQVVGNTYSYGDKNVKLGKKYSYLLEVVGVYGYSYMTDPVQVRIQ